MGNILDPKRDLQLERVVDVKPEQLWKFWTDPKTYGEWFCPKPWSVTDVVLDLKPGGVFKMVMLSPEGERFPSEGCVLEVIPNKKLVWTSALQGNFRPAPPSTSHADLFMTATVELTAVEGGTKYVATCIHRDEVDRKKHAEMGFQEGWGAVLDQLVKLCKTGKV